MRELQPTGCNGKLLLWRHRGLRFVSLEGRQLDKARAHASSRTHARRVRAGRYHTYSYVLVRGHTLLYHV